jgi:hypothetical protein
VGILNWLGIAQELPETIDAVSKLYTTDKDKLADEQKLEETLEKPTLAQIGVNKILATSSNIFKSGFMPLIGWTSGFCIALYWIPRLSFTDYYWIDLCIQTHKLIDYPIKPDELYNLLWLIFGFGGYRLIDKKMIT